MTKIQTVLSMLKKGWVGPLKAAQMANSLRFSGIIYEIKKKHILEHRDVKV